MLKLREQPWPKTCAPHCSHICVVAVYINSPTPPNASACVYICSAASPLLNYKLLETLDTWAAIRSHCSGGVIATAVASDVTQTQSLLPFRFKITPEAGAGGFPSPDESGSCPLWLQGSQSCPGVLVNIESWPRMCDRPVLCRDQNSHLISPVL